jgi:phosphohistidine phosphatase
MKRIILFRHGKSNWNFSVNDAERDLEKTGKERTKKSAEELRKKTDFEIDAWFSSPAKRARKTAEITGKYFENNEIKINDSLYTFSFFDLLKEIKKLDGKLKTVIVFGHNEAFTEFVNRMGSEYLDNLPTSGVAVIEFDSENWNAIEKGETKLIIKPKNL